MVGDGNDLYFGLWTLRGSLGCSLSLLVCIEAIISPQERGDPRHIDLGDEEERNIDERKTNERRGDKLL